MGEKIAGWMADPSGLVLIFLGAFAVFGVLSLFLAWTRHPQTPPSTLHRLFIVLLRVAIGWHFLVEGWDKLKSDTWTSEAYLREASGPLAPLFRGIAGDRILDQASLGPNGTFPSVLAAEWDGLFEAYKSHYQLDNREVVILVKDEKNKDHEEKKTVQQLVRAKDILDQAKQQFVDQYRVSRTLVEIPSDLPPALKFEMTLEDQVKKYHELEKEVRDLEAQLPKKGSELFPQYKSAKANFGKFRNQLKGNVAYATANLKSAWDELLTPDQKAKGPPPRTVQARPIGSWSLLDWSDRIVKYGLVGIGGCLIAGLFTRLAAFLGAMLLLSFFVTMPPLPYLPAPPNVEGHYLFINKNLIEMLALLVIATCRSGWWLGLDGLLRFANPFTWNKPTN